jgi:hypothetical protein
MTHTDSAWWPSATQLPPLTLALVLLGTLVDLVWQPMLFEGSLPHNALQMLLALVLQGGLWVAMRRWPSYPLGALVTAVHLVLHGLLSWWAMDEWLAAVPGTLELWCPLGLWVLGIPVDRVRRARPRTGPRPLSLIAMVGLTLALPVLGELVDLVLQPMAFGYLFMLGLAVVPPFTLAQLIVISLGDTLLLALTWLERRGPGWQLQAALAGMAISSLTGMARGSVSTLVLGALAGWRPEEVNGWTCLAAFVGLVLGQWEHFVLVVLWGLLWFQLAPTYLDPAERAAR